MIEPKTVHRLICDNCGLIANDGRHPLAWPNDRIVRQQAHMIGYVTVNGKDYCPACALQRGEVPTFNNTKLMYEGILLLGIVVLVFGDVILSLTWCTCAVLAIAFSEAMVYMLWDQ